MVKMENNKLNIVVIGCSGMGRNHMKGVCAQEGAVLYGVCDIHDDVLFQARDEFNVPHTTNDYMDFVNDPAVDAAVIVTPDPLHMEMSVAFMRAGKDVLCEKPMTLSVAECVEMMKVEKETGRKLMIGQVCHFAPAFRKAKELVEAGAIGELFFVESEYAHNYDHARGRDDWRVVPERDGFIGGACHAVDLLRWIAGDPIETFAYANHKCLTDWPTNDCTVALFKFPNDVAGKVFGSIGCRRNYTMRSVFYGTEGTIICDNTSDSMQLFQIDKTAEDGKGNYTTPQIIPVEINNHNVTAEITLFLDALVSGGEMPVKSMEGAKTVTACRAAIESAATGKPIQIQYPVI